MSKELWNNNEIQFARLICEIVASLDVQELALVADSMDLPQKEIQELYDRAETVWVSAQIQAVYGGECPDCFDDIPPETPDGGECSNCGHVFWLLDPKTQQILNSQRDKDCA